jgi:hypothetical protein
MVDRLLEEASKVIVSPQIKQIVKEVKIHLRDEVEPSGVHIINILLLHLRDAEFFCGVRVHNTLDLYNTKILTDRLEKV